MRVSEVKFISGRPADIETGLVGWISCILNGTILLDGLTLRRTASGRLALSFPARTDSRGIKRFYVRPLSDTARREIEAEVFRTLGITEETHG